MKKDYEDEYTEPEYTEDGYAPEEGDYTEPESVEGEGAQSAEGDQFYGEETYEEGEYYAEDGTYEEGEYYAEDGSYEEGEYYAEDGAYVEGEYYAEDGSYEEGQYYAEDGQYAEEYYEDDMVYEDELVVAPKPKRKKRKGGLLGAISKMSTMDKLITTSGVLVLVLALVVGSLYISTSGAQQQVSSFDTIGEQLSHIESYIGESGLLAVADAEQARIDAANALEEEEENDFWDEYDEEDYVNEVVVKMNLTTIQKDLKIKFVNKKSGKLIGNVPFQVKIEKPDGTTENKTDDDMDGVIYLTDIDAGKYTVTMYEFEDEKYENYDISTVGKTVNVKDEIKYEKVDVADEVKDESEINAKEEDTAQKEEIKVESELKDTVTWVESTKNQVYEAVKKADVPAPATAAVSSLFRRLTEEGTNPSTDQTTEPSSETPPAETVSITGVAISGNTTIDVNGSTTLTATVSGTGAFDGTVSWNSSDPSVASVAGGVVTGLTAGSTTITATSNGDSTKSASVTVTVNTPVIAVTGITLSNTTLTMDAGASVALTATVSPDNATDKTVTWSSNSTDVTVSNGTVTASSAIATQTTAVITASCGGFSANCTVTVNPVVSDIAVDSITLDKTTATVAVDGTITLTATVLPADATDPTVTWNSDNQAVATVNNGVVTGVSAGTANITAKAGDKTATCVVTVEAAQPIPVASITLSKKDIVLDLVSNKTATITATVLPADATNPELTWESSIPEVASVDSTGKVVALKKGITTIIVRSVEDKTIQAVCGVEVKEGVSMTISQEALALDLVSIKTATLVATISGASSSAVTWTSSNTSVATVDNGGKVTAVGVGEAVITVTSVEDPNVSVSCSVVVTATNATLISLDQVVGFIYETGTLKLTATTTPANLPVQWESSNKAVATVDNKGTVTGVAAGTADITAFVEQADGTKLTAKCTVMVEKLLKLEKTTLSMVAGSTGTVTITLGDEGDGTLQAFSANPSALKVSIINKSLVLDALAINPSVGVTVAYTTKSGTRVSQDIYVSITDDGTKLTDKSGKQLYVLGADGKYTEASASDYYKYDTFYVQTTRYTGWQTINGKVFFFNVDGKYVTGEQVIQGAKYKFGSDGALVTGDGVFGIDVSKWNGTIDWNAVKNSGVNYVIIRCGYRGSSKGSLIEDPKFEKNIKGATAAGLKVGVYFFTQAINEVEAVEEASMVLGLIKNYKISYPVFLDVESSGGRADGLDSATRTKVIKAFCETIENSGYTAGIYANKSWFEKKMDVSQLTKYKIWLAQYAAAPTYTKSKVDLWQYKSTGKVSGISGNVDLNISYLGY